MNIYSNRFLSATAARNPRLWYSFELLTPPDVHSVIRQDIQQRYRMISLVPKTMRETAQRIRLCPIRFAESDMLRVRRGDKTCRENRMH